MQNALKLLLLSALALPVRADDPPLLHFSGFGSLVATRTDDSAIGFKRNFQTRSSSNDWRFDADSLLGVQMNLNLNPEWYGVVQVVGMQREQGRFQPYVEWANLAWQPNASWRWRLGRMVTPVTSSSESRNIAYALLSTRAQLETVGIYPMLGHDGADLRYRTSFGRGEVRLQAFAGQTRYQLPFLEYKVDRVLGTALSYALSDWTFRYAYTHIGDARATGGSYLTAAQPLLAGLNAIAPYCVNVECSDTIVRINRLTRGWGGPFHVLSASYDDGRWNLLAEYATRKLDTFISDGRSLATLAGYHVAAFTPYIGFSRADSTNRHTAVHFQVSDPNRQASADTLAAVVSNSLLLPQAANRKVSTLGLRWDPMPDLALKFQLDQIRHKYPQAPYNGFYVHRTDPDGRLLPYDGKVRLYSVSADFVF